MFDVFRHRMAGGEGEGDGEEIVFLSMELLRGETLAERLERTGPLGIEEAPDRQG